MDDLGVPLFLETPMYIMKYHVCNACYIHVNSCNDIHLGGAKNPGSQWAIFSFFMKGTLSIFIIHCYSV